jgi:uncharacterized MAPEG superfamily protein
VAGNAAGVATERLNQLTTAYLLSRAVYVYTYVVLQDNARMAGLRPFVCKQTIIRVLFFLFWQELNR